MSSADGKRQHSTSECTAFSPHRHRPAFAVGTIQVLRSIDEIISCIMCCSSAALTHLGLLHRDLQHVSIHLSVNRTTAAHSVSDYPSFLTASYDALCMRVNGGPLTRQAAGNMQEGELITLSLLRVKMLQTE